MLALDKPAGWLLAPETWRHTSRNLQTALVAGIRAGEFWARVRALKYLRFVHRLDAETTGVLLLAKSPGALRAFSELFETRAVEKRYLAVVRGRPKQGEWVCRLKLAPDPQQAGRMRADARGKEAETRFGTLQAQEDRTLIEARPLTGRTHQIRVHLAESGFPVIGDVLYGGAPGPPARQEASREEKRGAKSKFETAPELALRAVELNYADPFTRRRVRIHAPSDDFLNRYGFGKLEAANGC